MRIKAVAARGADGVNLITRKRPSSMTLTRRVRLFFFSIWQGRIIITNKQHNSFQLTLFWRSRLFAVPENEGQRPPSRLNLENNVVFHLCFPPCFPVIRNFNKCEGLPHYLTRECMHKYIHAHTHTLTTSFSEIYWLVSVCVSVCVCVCMRVSVRVNDW